MIDPEIKTEKTPKPPKPASSTKGKRFPFYRYGNMQGLIAGSIMAAYLLLLQAFGFDHSPGLKMVKYLFLGIVLYNSLLAYNKYLPEGQLFKNGIVLGAYITAISSLVVIFANLVAFNIGERFSFNKFSLPGATIGEVMMINGILFFETFVFGMILTFIWLQYLKSPKPAK